MAEDDNHGSGFNDRVDKIFGSISSSNSKSKSLWSVSDAQIERRVWNKSSSSSNDDDDQTPLSSSFENHNNQQVPDEDEFWNIRSSIGLDSTLDFEKEEDEYDKIAQGKENHDDDRLYMNDVTHPGPYLNSRIILQPHHDIEEPPCKPPPSRIKSILKTETRDMPKPAKRVRFDPSCKSTHELQPQRIAALPQQNTGRSLPDYIRNPSNYTRYDFHETSLADVIEPCNRNLDIGSSDAESSAVLPKSVVFIPRKKRGNGVSQRQQSTGVNAIGIADLEVQQEEGDEIRETQQTEEESESRVCTRDRFQTPRRQYRSKMEEDDAVC